MGAEKGPVREGASVKREVVDGAAHQVLNGAPRNVEVGRKRAVGHIAVP
jgi:hypothetical protein